MNANPFFPILTTSGKKGTFQALHPLRKIPKKHSHCRAKYLMCTYHLLPLGSGWIYDPPTPLVWYTWKHQLNFFFLLLMTLLVVRTFPSMSPNNQIKRCLSKNLRPRKINGTTRQICICKKALPQTSQTWDASHLALFSPPLLGSYIPHRLTKLHYFIYCMTMHPSTKSTTPSNFPPWQLRYPPKKYTKWYNWYK